MIKLTVKEIKDTLDRASELVQREDQEDYDSYDECVQDLLNDILEKKQKETN